MKKILPTKITSNQKLFGKIGIKTVREYQELYKISDALLLADVYLQISGTSVLKTITIT